MSNKLVTYTAPTAPEVDGLTLIFVLREFGKIANAIKALVLAWSSPSFAGPVVTAKYTQVGVVTVATLPAAAASNKGAQYMVSDANATAFWGIVAGGGANIVPVTSDGTNWRIG